MGAESFPELAASPGAFSTPPRSIDDDAKDSAGEHPALTPEMLRSLAQAITGPQVRQFEFPSSRDPSTKYVVSVSGGDVDCTCPGFQYRGTCRHVIEVKKKLALK